MLKDNSSLYIALYNQDKISELLDIENTIDDKSTIISLNLDLTLEDIFLFSHIKKHFKQHDNNNIDIYKNSLNKLRSLHKDSIKVNFYNLSYAMLYLKSNEVENAYELLAHAFYNLNKIKDSNKLIDDEKSFLKKALISINDYMSYCSLVLSSKDFKLSFLKNSNIFIKTLYSNIKDFKELYSIANTRFTSEDAMHNFEYKFLKLSNKIFLALNKFIFNKKYRIEFFCDSMYLTFLIDDNYIDTKMVSYIRDMLLKSQVKDYLKINIGLTNLSLIKRDNLKNFILENKEKEFFSEDKVQLIAYREDNKSNIIFKDKKYTLYLQKKDDFLTYDNNALYLYKDEGLKNEKCIKIDLDNVYISLNKINTTLNINKESKKNFYLIDAFYNDFKDVLNLDLVYKIDTLTKLKLSDKLLNKLIYLISIKLLSYDFYLKYVHKSALLKDENETFKENFIAYDSNIDADISFNTNSNNTSYNFISANDLISDDKCYLLLKDKILNIDNINYESLFFNKDFNLNASTHAKSFNLNFETNSNNIFYLAKKELLAIDEKKDSAFLEHIDYLKMNIFFGTLVFKLNEKEVNTIVLNENENKYTSIDAFANVFSDALLKSLKKSMDNFNLISLSFSKNGYLYMDILCFDMLSLSKGIDSFINAMFKDSVIYIVYYPCMQRSFCKDIYTNSDLYLSFYQNSDYILSPLAIRAHIGAYKSNLKANIKDNILNALSMSSKISLINCINDNNKDLLFINDTNMDIKDDDFYSLLEGLSALSYFNRLNTIKKDKKSFYSYNHLLRAIGIVENLCIRNNYYFNFYILSLLYVSLGDIEKSRFAIEKAINLNKNAAIFYYQRAILNYLDNLKEEALHDLNKAFLNGFCRSFDKLKNALFKNKSIFNKSYKRELLVNYQKYKGFLVLKNSDDEEVSIIFNMSKNYLYNIDNTFIKKLKEHIESDFIKNILIDNVEYKFSFIYVDLDFNIQYVYKYEGTNQDRFKDIYKLLSKDRESIPFIIDDLPLFDDEHYETRLQKLNLILENEKNKITANAVTNDSNVIKLSKITC